MRPDGHLDAPYPLDFFVWVVRSTERTIVVDTGFDEKEAARRERSLICRPGDALAMAGVDAAVVRDVVVTHLHCDHAGGIEQFPNAIFHVQDAEMAFATGRYMDASAFRARFQRRNCVRHGSRSLPGSRALS